LLHLPNAAFAAIDEEMTGISIPSPDGRRIFFPKDDTPSMRYNRTKGAAERYSIIQFGITLFFEETKDTLKKDDDSQKKEGNQGQKSEQKSISARIYNFHLFSSKREIVLNPSTVDFLTSHGTDFNLWMKQGIAYVTGKQAKEMWSRFEKKHRPCTSYTLPQKKMEITRSEDITFIARTMAMLREWLDSAGSNSFALPPCNSYRRRALYETIGAEYPTLVLEKGDQHNIIVLRLSPEEKEKRDLEKKMGDEKKVERDQVGFYKIIEALSKANKGLLNTSQNNSNNENPTAYEELKKNLKKSNKIPIIVHNGFMDLLFILTHFHDSSLPQSWSELKILISSYFPLVYDTRFMVTECSCQDYEQKDLSSLFVKMYPGKSAESAHDAGYDSFMTGSVFYKLCQEIMEQGGSANTAPHKVFEFLNIDKSDTDCGIFGRNKLNFMQILYQIDLENIKDPMKNKMKPETTFRISNIDPSLKTNEILQRIAGRHFEIIWVDDTTFLLSSTIEENVSEMEAFVKSIFYGYTVECLSDYLMKQEYDQKTAYFEKTETKSTFSVLIDSFMTIFGGERGIKRQRIQD